MRFMYSSAIWFVFLWTAATASANNKHVSDDDANQLPHIVMIVVDDLGSHDLGLHGTGIHTPNIDGFVTGNGNGIYLDEYYVLPYCSPTRAGLLSGMYPLRTGVHQVIEPTSTAGLPLNVETLPEMLKRATTETKSNSNYRYASRRLLPYQTHAVGKWHVGHSSWEQTPTFRGFDSFFGFYQGGQDYFTHKAHGGVDLHFDRSPRCGKGCSEVVDERGNYSTHVFTRESIKVVKNHAKRFQANNTIDDPSSSISSAPLFLYLAYQAVHCPDEVPPRYSELYQNRTDWSDQRKTYAGMLTAADEGIGNLTAVLKEIGLWENTLVILTTDNGGPTTVGCVTGASNYPKRGGKCSLWEGGTTGDALLAGPALEKLLSKSNSDSRSASRRNLSKLFSNEKVKASVRVGVVPPNGVSDTNSISPRMFPSRFRYLFHVVDWFPTLAEWVGVVPLNATVLDGVSQAKALEGGDTGGPARTELFGGYSFWDYDSSSIWYGPSIRHLNWKLVQGVSGGPDANDPNPPGSKDIVPPGDHDCDDGDNNCGYLLFDLDNDPSEENDLSGAYPEILKKMVYKLKLYRKSFVYPQINDDSECPFPGLVNTTNVGPAWIPWCNENRQPALASK